MVGIYKITSPSGKIYIGQSWNIVKRKKDHRNSKRGTHLANSIKKYGFDSHGFEVVHELPEDVDQSVLDVYEQLYIDSYRDSGFTLLNLKEGGSNGKMSDELRRKMSIAKQGMGKGRIQSEEWKSKRKLFSANNGMWLGKKHSVATREKQRGAQIGKPKSPEHAAKCVEIGKMQALANRKPVNQISVSGDFIKTWPSAKDAELNGVANARSICHALKGRYRTAGGFKWSYA